MESNLNLSWKKIEADYMNFCMDLFDEKPLTISVLGIIGDPILVVYNIKPKVLEALAIIVTGILRFLFVKKYIATKTVEQVSTILKKQIRTVKAGVGLVVEVLGLQISGSTQVESTFKIGFT